jgi:DNA-binding Lrp family transcriptional regulator
MGDCPLLIKKEGAIMPRKDTDFRSKLTSSATAVLRVLQSFEDRNDAEIFDDSDPDASHLRKMVRTYRGSLYSEVTRRLAEVITLGGVSVVTQRDVVSLVEEIWDSNVSRCSPTELEVLKGVLEDSSLSLRSLSSAVGLSYAQTRRAAQRLRASGVLHIKGLLNTNVLGLERILIILENPTLVLSGPYIHKALFVDSPSSIAFLVSTLPRERVPEVLKMIKSLRGTAGSVSAWKLSAGKPRFSDVYYNVKTGEWRPNLFHFRLMLRVRDDDITVGTRSFASTIPSSMFTSAELQILERIVENYEATAVEITESTDLSESTAFKKRSQLISNRVVVPRATVTIPKLKDRVIAIMSPDCAGGIVPAWSQLPLTYVARLENLENPSEKKILLLSALASGSASDLIDVLYSEKSRVDDFIAHSVTGGITNPIKVASMFDRREKRWKWDPSYFDLLSYGIARKESGRNSIPLDLA